MSWSNYRSCPCPYLRPSNCAALLENKITKVLTSSGTTGSAVSRIYLDSETAQLQSRVLVKIMQHFLGADRRPLVILDHDGVVKARKSYSARGAGVVGILPFGRQPIYAMREDLTPDLDILKPYLQANKERVGLLRIYFPGMAIRELPQSGQHPTFDTGGNSFALRWMEEIEECSSEHRTVS